MEELFHYLVSYKTKWQGGRQSTNQSIDQSMYLSPIKPAINQTTKNLILNLIFLIQVLFLNSKIVAVCSIIEREKKQFCLFFFNILELDFGQRKSSFSFIKTESVILSDPLCKNVNARLPMEEMKIRKKPLFSN